MNRGALGMWVGSMMLAWAGGALVATTSPEPGPVLASGVVSIYVAGFLLGLDLGGWV
jgi:hypothetical protein